MSIVLLLYVVREQRWTRQFIPQFAVWGTMQDAFDTNLIALLPRLRRFAVSLTRNHAAADDLVQITCEKALANASGFEPGTNLNAWLFRIMRNSWIDHTRKVSNTGTTVELEHAFDIAGSDGRTDTENHLLLKETRTAIAGLPDDQRNVLVLVCVEDMSYQETSDILDVPIGTVMSRLARARKKLADQLGINSPGIRSPGSKE